MRHFTPYFAILPVFAFLVLFGFYPLAGTFYYSFTRWDGLNVRFIGWLNYERIVFSGQLLLLLRNNLIILLSVPLIIFLSLVVTILLHERVKGWQFFRSVYYIPTVLSAVVAGFLMRTSFAYNGLVNEALRAVGLDRWATDWLGQVPTAFMVIIIAFYWQTLGQGVLIFLAGMATVPFDVIEAARIDGAGWWKRLVSIILPMLLPSLTFFLLHEIIWVFTGLFSHIFTITEGGPGYETTPIDYMIYLKAFQEAQLGYASALAVLLFIVVLIIAIVQLRIARRLEAWR